MNDLNVSSYGYITPADKALVVSFLSTLKSEISYPERCNLYNDSHC